MQSEQSQDVKLTLGDGSVVLANGKVIKPGQEIAASAAAIGREVSSGRQAVRVLEKMHRKLGDLPDMPAKMNPIAAIITYTAIGLSNDDIATSLGATAEQIATIKDSEAYQQLEQMFDQTVFEDERRNAKHIISQASTRAAQTMVAAVDSADENIALVASRDVLKLSGITTEEQTDKRFGGLTIKVIRKNDAQEDEIRVEMNNA